VHGQLTERDDLLSATASLVEAVSNGITCTIEAGTVAHPHQVAHAFETVGVRGTVARWGWDIGDGPQVGSVAEVLQRQQQLVVDFNTSTNKGLVTAWVSLVGHDLMSDELVIGASQLARDNNTNLTFHISPHSGDVESYLSRTGKRPLIHLRDLGVLGSHVLLAHAVHLSGLERDAIIDTNTAVVSCPWAYLRLAQGITGFGRHAQLMRSGARLSLGCDSENAGDAIDMIRTAALFIGLARDGERDPTIASAYDALELITIRGARAIGMEHLIGSIEVGKRADIVIHSTSGPQWTPLSPDPILQLIWASDGRSVSDVVVNGVPIIRDSICRTIDETALREEVGSRGRFLLSSLGKG
jgi:5-methylthioadenosine/S-adenosylhomocysteine deaminase